jgi:hypothetical protein
MENITSNVTPSLDTDKILIVVDSLKHEQNIQVNTFSYFDKVFNKYLEQSSQGKKSKEQNFYEQPLNEIITKDRAPIYRWQEEIYGGKNIDILAIPFILSENDDIVKYFYVKRNNTGYVEIFIIADKDSIGCPSNRNQMISIFNVSGRLRKSDKDKITPVVLGLSNSPSDCLAIVKNDTKLCNATNLIKIMLKISNYFGIYEIKLGDSAGIQCRMDTSIGKNTCGLIYNEKNIPLSLQRRILNKKGFYEEMGFVPEGDYNYDNIFSIIGDSKMVDIISSDDLMDYKNLYGTPKGSLRDFLFEYSNMKPIEDGKDNKRCKWLENFLTKIYEGKNEVLYKIFENQGLDYPLIMKKYKTQSYKKND